MLKIRPNKAMLKIMTQPLSQKKPWLVPTPQANLGLGGVLAIGPRYGFVNLPLTSQYYHKQLPTRIEPALILAQKEEKLNEKCYLLENAVQIVLRDPKMLTNTAKEAFCRELKLWEKDSGRFTRIITVSWIILRLGLKDKLAPLYEDIAKRVLNDEWYVTFDESVKAMEVFTDYHSEDLKSELYGKIERNLELTLSDVNMVYYERITQALLDSGRYDSELWNVVEGYVLRNLGMPYKAHVFFNIFKAFAISRNGTDVFYEVSQQILFKGHAYRNNHMMHENLREFDSSGEYFAMLAETYAVAHKFTPFPLDPDFLNYLFKSLKSEYLQYEQVSSLTRLLRALPQISFDRQEVDEIFYFIVEKKEFVHYSSLEEIEQLFQEALHRYGRIPPKLLAKVEALINQDVKKKIIPLPKAVEAINLLCVYLEKEGQTGFSTDILQNFEEYLRRRYKYLKKEEAQEVRESLEGLRDMNQAREFGISEQVLMIPGK